MNNTTIIYTIPTYCAICSNNCSCSQGKQTLGYYWNTP